MADPLRWKAFDLFFRPWMRRRIADVLITGLGNLPDHGPRWNDRPLLLCPNHTSWWDGFLARDVARLLRPDAPFHVLALERELVAHPILRFLGGIGVRPGSVGSVRGAIRRVDAIGDEKRRPVVTIFPQGRIGPLDRRPLGFRDGVRHFRRVLRPCWTIPVALRLEPLTDARPTAFVSIGPPVGPSLEEGALAEELEARVTDELDALAWYLAVHGENAAEAWPGPDGRLPQAPTPSVTAPERRVRHLVPRPSLN